MWGLRKSPVFIKNARNRFRKICRSSSILNGSGRNLEDRSGECSEWLGDRSRRKDLPFQIDAFKYFKAPIFLLWVHNSAEFQPSGYTFIHFHRSEPQRKPAWCEPYFPRGSLHRSLFLALLQKMLEGTR